jgi:hypothetical protein
MIRLTRTQQLIFDAVRRRPRTVSELINLVWWIHPQDAPQRSTIKAHVWHLNRRLRPHGLAVRSARGGNHQRDVVPYQLIGVRSCAPYHGRHQRWIPS